MRYFNCICGNRVFFDNTKCLNCGRHLGYLPEQIRIAALEPVGDLWRALGGPQGKKDKRYYRYCANHKQASACNWMLRADAAQPWCRACELNEIIPNIQTHDNQIYWRRIEIAKRHLIYTLDTLGLPLISKKQNAKKGLAFAFLSSQGGCCDYTPDGNVLTSHRHGVIILNIAEADPVIREQTRVHMHESYRTLLGHLRHEIAHYYWDRLIVESEWLKPWRQLFGDERYDYNQALNDYYLNGAVTDWPQRYISAYASAHPWEDWAESFAHYLHMIDSLETAQYYELAQRYRKGNFRVSQDFSRMFDQWIELGIILNALNRSLGLDDAYPFVISYTARRKLDFVHRLIMALRRN